MRKFLSLTFCFLLSFSCQSARVIKNNSNEIPIGFHVGTGAYTVPINRYGIARVNCRGNQTFAINGTIVLTAMQYSVLGTSPIQAKSISSGVAMHSQSHGGGPYVTAFVSSTVQQSITQTYKLTPSQNISGCSYYIELYAR